MPDGGLPRLRRDGTAPRPGIVHLGLGAFFRAHGAIYTEDAMQSQGGDWGIVGVSLRSPGVRDKLAPQNWAYSAVELASGKRSVRVVNILNSVLVAREDPGAVLDAMCAPETRIVSLTVTEKGYCHSPASGQLNFDHPDIEYDLSNALPRSAPGFIVRALQKRRAAGLAPFTVMSCDNLPNNGQLIRDVILDLAERIEPDLRTWIDAEGRFPATMVDRIVPAASDDEITQLAAQQGSYDAAPVMHESFRQWVIQDDFVDDARPHWHAAGAELVSDVSRFEDMKLRMLNGTHSALAYLGYLAGYESISATVADLDFRNFVQGMWRHEISQTITAPESVSLDDYAEVLLKRYDNPSIHHRCWQIAMDGSQKLPQRILGTLMDNIASGRDAPRLCLAVAGWMRYVGGLDEDGAPIDVRDPLADQLRDLSASAEHPAGQAEALLSVREVFSADQARALHVPIVSAYETLVEYGAKLALNACLQEK